MFSDIIVNNSISTVYRFVYGATFPEFEFFPNAGASEGTECESSICVLLMNIYENPSTSCIRKLIQSKQLYGGSLVENNADHLGKSVLVSSRL